MGGGGMGSGGTRGKYRGGGPTGRRRFTHGLVQMNGGPGDEEGHRKKSGNDEGSGEEEDEEEEEEEEKKRSATDGLIEIHNPNAPKKETIKASQVDVDAPVEMTRREREAIEKQKNDAAFWKAHEKGETEEARKDMERLTLIRQQREEAAKKRAEEKAEADAKKAAAGPAGGGGAKGKR